jgi:hypothetical protein
VNNTTGVSMDDAVYEEVKAHLLSELTEALAERDLLRAELTIIRTVVRKLCKEMRDAGVRKMDPAFQRRIAHQLLIATGEAPPLKLVKK